jgi:hypothetical protein
MSAALPFDVPVTGQEIAWKPFANYQGFVYKILNVDVARRNVDMVLRFEPDSVCFYHRHWGPVASLVLEGEHHLQEVHADGSKVTKVRRQGEYTVSTGNHAHIEGGGPHGGTIFFSFRSDQDHIYDILDDKLAVVHEVTVQDFRDSLDNWSLDN